MKNEIKEMNLSEMLFNRDERLLEYITNLQIIEQQYSSLLSENAELENKITNLQEENENLLKKSYSDDVRITKAIEILKDTNVDMPSTLLIEIIDYARHILNGGDDNETN